MNVNPLGEGTVSVVVQQSQGNPSGGSADLDFVGRRPPRFLSPRGLTGANIRGACPFIAVFPVYSTTSVVVICSQYVYVVLIREETRINGQAPSPQRDRALFWISSFSEIFLGFETGARVSEMMAAVVLS